MPRALNSKKTVQSPEVAEEIDRKPREGSDAAAGGE
jgi:hypothetical protein